MNYIFYKNQKTQKTFILLDGNSIPLFRSTISPLTFWVTICIIVLLLCWYQVAENCNIWTLRELSPYNTTYTVNQLQKSALDDIRINTYALKKKFLALKKDSAYLQDLLGFADSSSAQEIKLADLEKDKVKVEKTLLGERIEKDAVVLNDQVVLEFYEDIEKDATVNIFAEQRALTAARQLKKFLDNPSLKKTVVVRPLGEESYVGTLGLAVLFTVDKNDSKYSNATAEETAQLWARNINQQVKRIAENRQKINMDNFIAMPDVGSYKRLQKEVAMLRESVSREQLLLVDLKKDVEQVSMHFAQTPSFYPLNRPISSTYGMRKHPITHRLRFHGGVDFWAWPGTRVYATASGRVSCAEWLSNYGNAVKIYHGQGYETLYGHNSKLLVNSGMWVRKGQLIALSGDTGLTEGAHLHYEVRRFGTPINPVRFLNLDIMSASKLWD